MDAPTYQTIKLLYLEARELARAERGRFLDERCAGQPSLRDEVEGLLAQSETLGEFLSQPAKGLLEPSSESETPSHPERIGAYRILRPLGFGGMGVVYLAEQDSPKRAVALKLLRFDRASPRQLERFEQEAELLGRLSHPGIARVYEAGWADTETGRRPFFAMEHVGGAALHEFVTERKLDLGAKLRLVSQVAEAVHYAHERGVVHRDLKPSNVHVDERGDPKVLDFGVARPLGSTSHATQTGQLVGTLSYMSPEQASGHSDIDARSDVYSLGVILYELLTGRLPVPTEGLALHEAVRRVREEEPIAAGSVRAELKGDLETVLGKALAKERELRYASAAELAEDLRLYLDHRPIRARRPTSLYVGWKLVRRHRVLSATVAALFLALSGAQYGWLVLRERGRALEREEQAGAFFRDLVARQELQSEVKRVQHLGELLEENEEASVVQLENWLAEAAGITGRIDRHWAELEALQAWADRPQPSDPIAKPEEKEFALEVQRDIVERIEAMSGPRGPISILRARLLKLRRSPSAGSEG